MADRLPPPPPPAGTTGSDEPADRDDDALSPDERAILARWQPPGPPEGFAARVLAAPRQARTPRRGRWLAAVGLAAAGAVATAVWWPAPAATARVTGGGPRQTLAARASVAVADRAVAVAEPGAALAWQRIGPAAVVGQERGDIFYRVDRGGPFTVVTPVGRIEVTGTCFRVEIVMSPKKHLLLGGAVGAAVAAAAVITVYEGKLVVVGDGGAAPAAAGERVVVRAGGAPAPAPPDRPTSPTAPDQPGPATVALALPPAPTEATTREELLARDKVQREQLAMMARQLAALQASGGGGRPGTAGLLEDGGWVDPTPAELAAWAKECRVKIDLPPIMRGEPMKIPPAWARELAMSDDELAVANQVFVDLAADWATRVRAWYVEATGDAAGADALSAQSMGQELTEKATRGEPAALQKRLAEERARLVAPPADLSKASPFERYFRAFADLGNEAERLLAAKLGADKAHGLRVHEGGWPMRMGMAGCADDEDGAAAGAP